MFNVDIVRRIFYAKTHFWQRCELFSKKKGFSAPKVEENGAIDSDFMFVNIEPHKPKKSAPY